MRKPWIGTPSPRRIARTALAVALGLGLGVPAGLSGLRGDAAEELRAGPVTHKPGHDRKTFSISGGVVGLYPGRTRDLAVTVSNPHSFAIAVKEIGVQVQTDPTHPGCSPSQVTATSFQGSFVVPKNGSTTRTGILSVTMKASAPDACQGAQMPLQFSGRAEKP